MTILHWNSWQPNQDSNREPPKKKSETQLPEWSQLELIFTNTENSHHSWSNYKCSLRPQSSNGPSTAPSVSATEISDFHKSIASFGINNKIQYTIWLMFQSLQFILYTSNLELLLKLHGIYAKQIIFARSSAEMFVYNCIFAMVWTNLIYTYTLVFKYIACMCMNTYIMTVTIQCIPTEVSFPSAFRHSRKTFTL
jgi:hypothetical protein